MSHSQFNRSRAGHWWGWIRTEDFLAATGLAPEQFSALLDERRIERVFDQSGRTVGFYDDSPPSEDELLARGFTVRSDYDSEHLTSFGVFGDGRVGEQVIDASVTVDDAPHAGALLGAEDFVRTVTVSQFLLVSKLAITDVLQLNAAGRLPLLYDSDGDPSAILEEDIPTATDLRRFGYEVPDDYTVHQIQHASATEPEHLEPTTSWSMEYGDFPDPPSTNFP